jgi:gpW
MPDLDPCTLLRRADQAWFDLSTGGSVRSVTDQNGERIEFSTANRAGLLSLMAALQMQCTTYEALALKVSTTRPVRFLF